MTRMPSIYSILSSRTLVGSIMLGISSIASAATNWTTAYCYSDTADAQPILYLGNPTAETSMTGKRPFILIASIPANQNPYNVTGEAKAGYYEGRYKANITREKTVVDMSALFSGANQPTTGIFMELSAPVLSAVSATPTTAVATLTFRLGEDELGFEGTALGTLGVKCDLR